MDRIELGATLVAAIVVGMTAPVLAQDADTSKAAVQNTPVDLTTQLGDESASDRSPQGVQIAGRSDRKNHEPRREEPPRISLNISGGTEYFYMPVTPSVFDSNGNGIGHTPGNLLGEGFNARLNVPLPTESLPFGRRPQVEFGFSYDQARRTTYTPLPFNIDAFAINGANSATTFGGSSQTSMSSELSIVRFGGDLMLASKYHVCGLPLKVEAGFGYGRWEQDHNFVPFSQNIPSSAFRMSDSVDTDFYNFKTGITASHRIGGGFRVMGGFDVGLGIAHSSLAGTQMLNNNDFVQSGSRTAFSANFGANLGIDYRFTPSFRAGLYGSYNYFSELPRVEYPSTTSGSPLHLKGDSAQQAKIDVRVSFGF